MSGVWREVTGPDSYEVHIRETPDVVDVISPSLAVLTARNLREFADEIEAAAMEPDNCARCGAYVDSLPDLCPPCRELIDDRDARRWTA